MSKGLKLLNKKRTSIPAHDCFITTRETVKQIRKELKVLDIIKKKVQFEFLEEREENKTIQLYFVIGNRMFPVTKQEYDLLKDMFLKDYIVK